MPQAEVPSDIDVEDKIIGPFTLKQFIYLAIGGMAIFILYAIFGKISFMVFVLTALPVGFITVLFVFYRFNEQPFEQFLAALIAFYKNPRQRFWRRDTTLEDIKLEIKEPPREIKKPAGLAAEKEKTLSHLEELALILDSEGWEAQNKKEENNL